MHAWVPVPRCCHAHLPAPPSLQICTCNSSSAKSALCLVSKRWQRVLYSTPELWSSMLARLSGDAEYIACKQRVMRRVGGMVASLHLESPQPPEAAERSRAAAAAYLPHLPAPTQLRSLLLEEVELSAAVLVMLPGQLQLDSLDLTLHTFDEAAQGAARLIPALPQLAQLRSLGLELRQLSSQLLGGVLRLRQLTSLRLSSYAPMPSLGELPSRVTLLSAWSSLNLMASHGPVASAPGRLPSPSLLSSNTITARI